MSKSTLTLVKFYNLFMHLTILYNVLHWSWGFYALIGNDVTSLAH
jgi:hypothetical protein